MRVLWLAGVAIAALLAAAITTIVCESTGDAPTVNESAAPLSPTRAPPSVAPAPQPETWLSSVEGLRGDMQPILISCLDADGDGRIGDAEAAVEGASSALHLVQDAAALAVPFIDGQRCLEPDRHADFYTDQELPGEVPSAAACAPERLLLFVVAIASAGSDLLDPSAGESLGLIQVVNGLQAALGGSGVPISLTLVTAAIFGAEQAQTNMERLLARHVAARLDRAPCMRAVLIGHSHGGVTVTSVLAQIEESYPGRLLGVAIDRTIALYDRPASELPATATLLNFFQTNEGWHGERIERPNVVNSDESDEQAPIAPSDGGGGLAVVTHKTLDDAPRTQERIVEAVAQWAQAPR